MNLDRFSAKQRTATRMRRYPNRPKIHSNRDRTTSRRKTVALAPLLGVAPLMLAGCSNYSTTLSPSQRR
jgi:hypothetical protein